MHAVAMLQNINLAAKTAPTLFQATRATKQQETTTTRRRGTTIDRVNEKKRRKTTRTTTTHMHHKRKTKQRGTALLLSANNEAPNPTRLRRCVSRCCGARGCLSLPRAVEGPWLGSGWRGFGGCAFVAGSGRDCGLWRHCGPKRMVSAGGAQRGESP